MALQLVTVPYMTAFDRVALEAIRVDPTVRLHIAVTLLVTFRVLENVATPDTLRLLDTLEMVAAPKTFTLLQAVVVPYRVVFVRVAFDATRVAPTVARPEILIFPPTVVRFDPFAYPTCRPVTLH